MKTIDEMLSEVADIVGTAPKMPDIKQQDRGELLSGRENLHNAAVVASIQRGNGVMDGLRTIPALSLALAKEIAYCVERGAQALGVNVVIALTDSRGRLMFLEAMDNSFIASIQAAQDKAFTAAALKMPTHIALEQSRGGALDGYTNGNGILMLGGGYPIEYDNNIVGAIGVSGGTKDQDMLLAKIGIEYFGQRIKTL